MGVGCCRVEPTPAVEDVRKVRGALAVPGEPVVFAFIDSWSECAPSPREVCALEIGPDVSAALGGVAVARQTLGVGRRQ